MTTAELRQAAVRLIEYAREHQDSHRGKSYKGLMDAQAVAQAFLAQNPDDDDELVTPEWVETLNPSGEGHEVSWAWGTLLVVMLQGNLVGLTFEAKTRGQFRRVVSALGVPLTEPGR